MIIIKFYLKKKFKLKIKNLSNFNIMIILIKFNNKIKNLKSHQINNNLLNKIIN